MREGCSGWCEGGGGGKIWWLRRQLQSSSSSSSPSLVLLLLLLLATAGRRSSLISGIAVDEWFRPHQVITRWPRHKPASQSDCMSKEPSWGSNEAEEIRTTILLWLRLMVSKTLKRRGSMLARRSPTSTRPRWRRLVRSSDAFGERWLDLMVPTESSELSS